LHSPSAFVTEDRPLISYPNKGKFNDDDDDDDNDDMF